MHQTQDIYSLTDFKQNSTQHLERLRATGRPEVLTVNGKAEAVVMSPETYDQLANSLIDQVREKIAVGLNQLRQSDHRHGDSARRARRERRALLDRPQN